MTTNRKSKSRDAGGRPARPRDTSTRSAGMRGKSNNSKQREGSATCQREQSNGSRGPEISQQKMGGFMQIQENQIAVPTRAELEGYANNNKRTSSVNTGGKFKR